MAEDAASALGATAGADATEDGGGAGTRPPRLLAWTFAAFHAALLVALVVGVLYLAGLAGDSFAALDTSVGVVAYLYLWAVAWWTNRRTLGAVGDGLVTGTASPSGVLVGATKWGGVAGLLVFLPALLVGVVLFVGAAGLEAVPFLLAGAAVGTVVSTAVGAGVGAGFALLDLGLLQLARAWLSGKGSDPGSPDD